MIEIAATLLAPWANYYIMIGSAAAALTGLMFVVITIVTGAQRTQHSGDGISTYSTPIVVHFGSALLTAAILIAPWQGVRSPAFLTGMLGTVGIAYVARLMLQAKRLTAYTPDIEDWVWYSAVPLLAYGAILTGAVLLHDVSPKGPFVLASGAAMLIFIGIRNAWDIVTYLAIGNAEPPDS